MPVTLSIVLCRLPLFRMAELVRNGEISPADLLEAHLRQINAVNPILNAFVMLAPLPGVEPPKGPLHGVPVTIKDSFDVEGLATQSGSRLRIGHRAATDATVVARLRAAGAILLGKTNTPELLASYETDNLVTGRTNNPWNPGRTPGGSSGGEAAAIAAFCSPGGVASDGGGSIRVPAHFCGIAGLKPTPGRIPGTGHFPTLGHPVGLTTTAGPMARCARDLQLLFSVLAGFDPQDPFSTPAVGREFSLDGARIGIWPQFYNVPADPEIQETVRCAAALTADIGLDTVEFEPRGLERAPNVWAFLFNQWPSVATRKFIEGHESEVHWTLAESLGAKEPTAGQVLQNLATRDSMRASLLRQMDGLSAVLMPVCGITAFGHREHKWKVGRFEIGMFQAMMPAVLANVLGLPSLTIPMRLSTGGLPIGVQLLGRPFEDELLMELAVRLEEARGPAPAVPEIP